MALPPLLLLALLLPALSSAAGPAAGIRGTWTNTPIFVPSCVNGVFPNTDQDPTRTFGCGSGPDVPPEFVAPPTPTANLPNYTKDNRRDHHHVVDGPVLGNGNIGVVVGGAILLTFCSLCVLCA